MTHVLRRLWGMAGLQHEAIDLVFAWAECPGTSRRAVITGTMDVRSYYESSRRERAVLLNENRCRECGCIDSDCSPCVERTGEPCYWVEPDLCSGCGPPEVDA